MSGKKVRWGILSTANIGMAKVTPGIQKSAHSEVVAIASRDSGKARAAADRLPASAVARKARAWFQSKGEVCQFMRICITQSRISAISFAVAHK